MEFIDFKRAVYKQFDALANNADRLYLTNVNKDELWDCYIDSYPEDERQSHTCNCCRQFIKPYGNVVAIVNNKLVSIWDSLVLDEPYATVARNLAQLVKSKPVCDVFVSKVVKLGTDKNNVWIETPTRHVHTWNHLFYKLPNHLLCAVSDSEEAVRGALRTNKTVLKRALDELSMDAFDIILDLISQGSLYRGDQYKSDLEAFVALKKKYEVVPREERDNFCWVESAKVGYVGRIRNTAIGTLLVDISNGRELDESVRAYERIVAPANYQRPKTIATKKMIQAAEARVIELGLMDALPRRHAEITDITVNDVIFADRNAKKSMLGNSVFQDLAEDIPVNPKKLGTVAEISIEDFIKDVVPNATSIEVLLEGRHINNLMTLTAPSNKNAKNLFKWPNNFAWTYNGDLADSSIKDKVQAAGGKVNGYLRCSLAWYNGDDLDIHIIQPWGSEINYSCRAGASGGVLDVDMNAGGIHSRKPVENVIWEDEPRMEGMYTVYVHNFNKREYHDVGFTVEIECNGEVREYTYTTDLRGRDRVTVAKFEYSKAKGIVIHDVLPSNSSDKETWNLSTNKFHKVSLLTLSPNYWNGAEVGNKHYFFILDGCKNPSPVRGFFNEYLRSELSQDRKTFEMLANKMKAPYSDNQLSGLGFSSTIRNSVICKVTGSFTRTIKVNF